MTYGYEWSCVPLQHPTSSKTRPAFFLVTTDEAQNSRFQQPLRGPANRQSGTKSWGREVGTGPESMLLRNDQAGQSCTNRCAV
mmetsp:Transcript_142017/g.247572  ORF Transcript_142017/g.247572 Transcript_142017/m.247572 type:complete len:83 (+) Transcript_142017:575-823(+)